MPFFGQHLPRCGAVRAPARCCGRSSLGYVTLSRILGRVRLFGHEIDLPGWRMAMLQVLLATVDVAITATIFYALLPHAPQLTWLIFLGVYVASYTAGLAANLPGGIGVFDTAMLLGLEPYVSAPHIVGAIVVFRLYYYVIPLFLAGTLFAGNEIAAARRRAAAARRAAAGRAGDRPLERAGLRRRQRHRLGRAVRRAAALPGRAGATGRFLLDRSGLSPTSRARPASSCRH